MNTQEYMTGVAKNDMKFWQKASQVDESLLYTCYLMQVNGFNMTDEHLLENLDKMLETERKIGEIEL